MCVCSFPETEIYIRDVKSRSQSLKERVLNICTIVWANKKKLAGTAGAWFILVRPDDSTR